MKDGGWTVPDAMLRIRDLTVRYGSLTAVNRMSVEVPEGEIFGIVGPNGAGKTTTLKVLAGLLLPDEGSVDVDGLDILTRRDTARTRIGYMADFFGVYDYLTVHEYLSFFGGLYAVPEPEMENRIGQTLETVNLAPKRDAFVRTLSRGMKQRLYFARALLHRPRLLILDEPASGMDPRGRAEMVETLKKANGEGATIVISSHILDELQSLCTSVGVMEAGRLTGVQPLRGAGPTSARRRVILLVAAEDRDRAAVLLKDHGQVHSIRPTEDGILLETRDDDAAVSEIVRHLVKSDVRVLLPRADAEDLRDIFLKMTRGELM
jgi:ABC-2 type transport system ATP-binding protein